MRKPIENKTPEVKTPMVQTSENESEVTQTSENEPEVTQTSGIEPEVTQTSGIEPEKEKTFEVLCERGEFGYHGRMYHHDGLDYATAEYLVSIGYPYIKLHS